MKKMSLLTLAAASFVGLVSCGNQPAPAPTVYTEESVMIDLAKVIFPDVPNPQSGTNYYPADSGGFFAQGTDTAEPTAEAPLYDVCVKYFNLAKTVSYLVVTTNPQAQSPYYVAGLQTADKAVDVTILTYDNGTTVGWQVQTKYNPIKEGFPSNSYLDEKLGTEGANLVRPEGVFESEYAFTASTGTSPRNVRIVIEGVNVFENDAYKTQLTGLQWTVSETADEQGYLSADDPNHKLTVEFKGAVQAATASTPEIKYSIFYVYNYEEYHYEPPVTPGTIDEVVTDFAAVIYESPKTADEYYNEQGYYQVGYGKWYLSDDPTDATQGERLIKYVANNLPDYVMTVEALHEDGDYGWVGTYVTSDGNIRISLQGNDTYIEAQSSYAYYFSIIIYSLAQ